MAAAPAASDFASARRERYGRVSTTG